MGVTANKKELIVKVDGSAIDGSTPPESQSKSQPKSEP